eukprot:TRINITY_DN4516_c0_g1_i1.p2 TRINITY_DN4516_c0_g1~~TRINITY_DN4516_c0_g1_i1.p2  ORF type:complete len:707 (-),score=176.75 TRINITY_DN4516_c0_g1_i1:2247-4367(-)
MNANISIPGNLSPPFLKQVTRLFAELDELKIPEGDREVLTQPKGTRLNIETWLQRQREKVVKKVRGKKEERERELFASKMENLLFRFEDARLNAASLGKEGRINATWGFIFYCRMFSAKNILPEKQVEHYKLLIWLYTQIASDTKTNLRTKIAMEIWSYLASHTEDPDCCLLGLQPADEVMRRVTLSVFQSEIKEDEHNDDTSRENLLLKILHWSEFKEDKAIAEEVRKYATALRKINIDTSNISTRKVRKGSIVIVKIPRETPAASNPSSTSAILSRPAFSFVYGRVDEKKGSTMKIFISPVEDTTSIFQCTTEEAFVIPNEFREHLRLGTSKYLEQLVKDPTSILYESVMEVVKDLCNTFLLQEDAIPSVQTIDRWNKNELSLQELPQVRKSVSKLTELLNSPPLDFFSQIDDYCYLRASEFYAGLDKGEILFFIPAKDKSLSELQHFLVSRLALAKQRFQRSLAICEGALGQLSTEKKEIMNGNKKNDLTSWWLGHIRRRVDKLLVDHNYDFDAVPNEYIDNPPKSLAAVKENLTIVQQCIRAFNAAQQLKTNPEYSIPEKEQGAMQNDMLQLLEKLKNDIYPKLDDFVAQAQIVLLDHFDCLDIQFDMIVINALMKLTCDDMGDDATMWIDRVAGEITYVEQMKKLENSTVRTDNKDIVPISGLIVGRIVRLENELQTVLEVWENNTKLLQQQQMRAAAEEN